MRYSLLYCLECTACTARRARGPGGYTPSRARRYVYAVYAPHPVLNLCQMDSYSIVTTATVGKCGRVY